MQYLYMERNLMAQHVEKLWKVLFVASTMYVLLSLNGCYATNNSFILRPTNQTAAYGEYVTFMCRVSSCDNILTFLVNGKDVGHLNLSSMYFRNSIVACDEGEHVAMLSIIINNKTLGAVKYVSCNLTVTTNGELRDISSSRAYIIDIVDPYLYPTCPQCPATTEYPYITNLPLCNTAHHFSEKLSMTQMFVIACILLLISLRA